MRLRRRRRRRRQKPLSLSCKVGSAAAARVAPRRPVNKNVILIGAKRSHQSPIRIKHDGKLHRLALAASAAPEKHWYRHVSQFLTANLVSGFESDHPLLAHVPGDSSSCTGGGAKRPITRHRVTHGTGSGPAIRHIGTSAVQISSAMSRCGTLCLFRCHVRYDKDSEKSLCNQYPIFH